LRKLYSNDRPTSVSTFTSQTSAKTDTTKTIKRSIDNGMQGRMTQEPLLVYNTRAFVGHAMPRHGGRFEGGWW